MKKINYNDVIRVLDKIDSYLNSQSQIKAQSNLAKKRNFKINSPLLSVLTFIGILWLIPVIIHYLFYNSSDQIVKIIFKKRESTDYSLIVDSSFIKLSIGNNLFTSKTNGYDTIVLKLGSGSHWFALIDNFKRYDASHTKEEERGNVVQIYYRNVLIENDDILVPLFYSEKFTVGYCSPLSEKRYFWGNLPKKDIKTFINGHYIYTTNYKDGTLDIIFGKYNTPELMEYNIKTLNFDNSLDKIKKIQVDSSKGVLSNCIHH